MTDGMDAVDIREAAVAQPRGSQALHRLLVTQSFKEMITPAQVNKVK